MENHLLYHVTVGKQHRLAVEFLLRIKKRSSSVHHTMISTRVVDFCHQFIFIDHKNGSVVLKVYVSRALHSLRNI